MTVGQAIYDLLERVGLQSDDNNLYRLAAQWIDISRAEAIRKYVREFGDELPPSMLRLQECVGYNKTKADCKDCYKYKLDLEFDILDLPDDIGIYSVARPGGKILERIGNPGQLQVSQKTKFAPTEYWYRIADDVYVVGRFPVDLKFDVTYVPNRIMDLDQEEEMPAPDEIMRSILDEAEKIARRRMGSPQDLNNDGKEV